MMVMVTVMVMVMVIMVITIIIMIIMAVITNLVCAEPEHVSEEITLKGLA